jgi:hypothetical protein
MAHYRPSNVETLEGVIAACNEAAGGFWEITVHPLEDLPDQMAQASLGDDAAQRVMHCYQSFAQALIDAPHANPWLCLSCARALRVYAPDNPAALVLLEPQSPGPRTALVLALCSACLEEPELQVRESRMLQAVEQLTGMQLSGIVHEEGHA